MLPFLTRLALVRSQHAYRQIPVCGSFNCCPTLGYQQQTLHTPRFGASGHIREGCPRRQLYVCIFYRFRLGICKKLAIGSGSVIHATLHWYLRRLHEQIRFQVHAVRLLLRVFHKFRTHFISGSHSSMLLKAELSQRKSCLQSVPPRLSARRMCLHPCMMLLSRRPTMWIADLQSRKASAFPVFSSLFMLPTASVSSISHPLTNPLISSRQYLAFSFGTTLINQGRADPGQIINVMFAILIGSFSLAMMAPEVQGKSLSFLSCRTRSPYLFIL